MFGKKNQPQAATQQQSSNSGEYVVQVTETDGSWTQYTGATDSQAKSIASKARGRGAAEVSTRKS